MSTRTSKSQGAFGSQSSVCPEAVCVNSIVAANTATIPKKTMGSVLVVDFEKLNMNEGMEYSYMPRFGIVIPLFQYECNPVHLLRDYAVRLRLSHVAAMLHSTHEELAMYSDTS